MKTLLRNNSLPLSLVFSFILTILFVSPFGSNSVRGQDMPAPTPTIKPTPTPGVTATPAKSTSAYGTPSLYPASPTPTITPPQNRPAYVAISSHDQPPIGDPQSGTTIEWVVYKPTVVGPDGTMHWPAVVVLHLGGFKDGDFYHALSTAPQDLAAAGFYTVVAGYPLAPPHSIKGQNQSDINSGRYPQQTRAIEAVIDAAKKDPNCYQGLVGVLGGSAGASHAAYVALDVTNTGVAWPFWSATARPKCVVGLSGQYDFSDRDQDVLDDQHFISDIENYTNSAVPYNQWAWSPVGLVQGATTFIPMYFLRATDDPGSPLSTQNYLWYALSHASVPPAPGTFPMWSVPNTNGDHAFGLWNDLTDDTTDNQGLMVKDRVIGFFKQYLRP